MLDGHSIDTLNTRWFRSQIEFVPQDNFLFNTTVLENIAYGLDTEYEKLGADTVMELAQEAAKTTKAHSFIMELPKGYHTKVGERGSQLSGGSDKGCPSRVQSFLAQRSYSLMKLQRRWIPEANVWYKKRYRALLKEGRL
ncbi:Fc.00g095420.m01.CDS01 [Cosmosporella sp. VM-42]